jgi:hypothetical protein
MGFVTEGISLMRTTPSATEPMQVSARTTTGRIRPANARQRLLTLRQASDLSGIPETSLRDLVARGALAEVRLPTMRRVWIDRQDLDRLIERSREVRG